jgi:hypothetical protein
MVMRYYISVFLLGLLVLPTPVQEPNEPVLEKPTHTLQLIQSQADKPIDVPVKLFRKGDKRLLANAMPDGQLMESEYAVSEDGKLKFQWAAIQRGGLIAIQFIGDRRADGSFAGKFVALVDGILREDMSGRFNLKTIEATKKE